MSLLDDVTVFGKDAVASSATDFDKIDLGISGRNLSANRHGAGYLNVHVNTVMDGTATKIQLYTSDNPLLVTTAVGDPITLTSAPAGSQFSVRLPDTLKRYVTVKCDATNTGKIDVFLGVPLAQH